MHSIARKNSEKKWLEKIGGLYGVYKIFASPRQQTSEWCPRDLPVADLDQYN